MLVLPSSYFAPVSQWNLALNAQNYSIENCENFVKQSYRSRCTIYGANGCLDLVVPLKKWKNHTPISEIKISYSDNWKVLHWRSIESAYRNSPYFEFYEETIKDSFFPKQFEYLTEWNAFLEKEIISLLKLNISYRFTDKYEKIETDWRKEIHPKRKLENQGFKFPKYLQVFEEKEGFLPNLSILDVLFNLGPQSSSYIKSLKN